MIRREGLKLQDCFLSALEDLEKSRTSETGLRRLFESHLAKKALMFNDLYSNPQIKELYDLVFNTSSTVEERQAYRQRFFLQDLESLLRGENVVFDSRMLQGVTQSLFFV